MILSNGSPTKPWCWRNVGEVPEQERTRKERRAPTKTLLKVCAEKLSGADNNSHPLDHAERLLFPLVSLNVGSACDDGERSGREHGAQRAAGESLFGFELPSCSFWMESTL